LTIVAGVEGPACRLGPEASVVEPLGTAPLFVWCVLGRDVFGFADGSVRGIGVSGVAAYEIPPGATEVIARPAHGIGEAEIEEWCDRVVVPFAIQLQEGLQVLHAGGALMSGIGVVALCGVTTAGKSTTVAGLGGRGHAPWADDLLVFTVVKDVPLVLPLPFELNLRPESVRHFAGAELARPDTAEPTPLAAVAILERHDDATAVRVTRLPPPEALAALLEHAFILDLNIEASKRRFVRDYAALVGSVPVARVSYPDDLARQGELLDAVEALAASPPSA